ncbi:MAG: hypothetical protein SF162_19430 [bacterium]|nr:hypothetical protein [bacterium]
MKLRFTLAGVLAVLLWGSAPSGHAANAGVTTANAGATAAQIDAPLGAPILAFDTAAQDRIVLYDLSNGRARDLQFGRGWHRVWSFSPDGCRFAFTMSDGLDDARLYTARIDGTEVRELVRFSTPPAGGWGVWEPQWSPNTADPRIAFTFIETQFASDGTPVQNHRIAWVRPEGGDPAFYSVTGDEHTPRWSPDGAWLAYVSYEQRPAGADPLSTAVPNAAATSQVREADLWVVGANGLNKTRRTQFPVGSVSMPRWSPDGDLIGFVFSPAPNNDQVWLIGSAPDATPTPLSLSESLALDLTWLPDSAALVAALRDFRGVAENRLWRLPLVGSADTDAVQIAGDPALIHMDYPRYSADGRWLAARSAYALALIDLQNPSYTLLDEAYSGNTPPLWSPGAYTGESTCAG